MDFELEFQESEVIFSDYSSDQSVESNGNENSDGRRRHCCCRSKKRRIPKKKQRITSSSSSLPINIPFRYTAMQSEPLDEGFDDDEDQTVRLPPHLIVERRFNGEIARSFSPLKGRNLCEVRNSILRMTGFLEG